LLRQAFREAAEAGLNQEEVLNLAHKTLRETDPLSEKPESL